MLKATACARPFSISTKKVTVNAAKVHRMTRRQRHGMPEGEGSVQRNMKPCQVLPDRLMIAATTLGPISDEARLVIPNKPKNTQSQRRGIWRRYGWGLTAFVAWRSEIGHHGLGIGIVRRLTQTKDDVVKPEFPSVVETTYIS